MADQTTPPKTTQTRTSHFPQTKNSMKFTCGFMLIFLICTAIIHLNPSLYPSSSTLFKTLSNYTTPSSFHNFDYTFYFPNYSSPSNFETDLPITSNDTNEQTSKIDDTKTPNATVSSSNDTVYSNNSMNSQGESEKVGVNSDGSLLNCDICDGKWVKDDSYPLYEAGSCPHIDEPFNCFLNHRPENGYEKYRWQPHGCDIPRLNGSHMLEMLRGKRLVFVGDSLNRNMWESLVCILRNSVEDKNKVFEVSGREEFRTEGSYSFIFEDYNCSVEFFRSPFLVQEWEVRENNGSTKETLRLDLVERQCDKYKDADVLIFNTGHWWSHDKTLRGQGYYQEGSHVYGELNVIEAFRRAVTTWARWVDANVNPKKTLVFFRGYSASHFGGGKWNSGGKCDKETEPFKTDEYLETYPPKMEVLEDVLKWMESPVFYLNITRLSDYRKDAHPSIYRAPDLTEEERHSPLRYQDCSHWCLPGVPDTWNELVYAQMLVRHHQRLEEEQQLEQRRKKTQVFRH